MGEIISSESFVSILGKDNPEAIAYVGGNQEHPNLIGVVKFFRTPYGGTLVSAEVYGLFNTQGFFGMHIHEFGDCTLPFDQTGMHYNPSQATHPNHAGDMPSLLGNNGYAWTAFYDRRFEIEDIIGKSVVIHSMRDDFTSQPAGDSGDKIGCGVIVRA